MCLRRAKNLGCVSSSPPPVLLDALHELQKNTLLQKDTGSFPGGSDGKASAYNLGDLGSIPGLGRSPGEGNGNPLQYSCLENSMDGGAWCATAHGVAESCRDTTERLHFHFHHKLSAYCATPFWVGLGDMASI